MTDYTVSSGVISSSTQYFPGDYIEVLSGGAARYNLMQGTNLSIDVGGLDNGNIITDKTFEFMSGSQDGDIISDGGTVLIYGYASEDAIEAGGTVSAIGNGTAGANLTTSGTTSNDEIYFGGTLVVVNNGVSTSDDIIGGALYVSWGSAVDSLIVNGLELVGGSQGLATGAVALSGGVEEVTFGGLSLQTTAARQSAKAV
jgi:hypothetical protein